MNQLVRVAPTVQRPWWDDTKMMSLVHRTAFKDCNSTEFDEAVAVSRDLGLSPLRKQIYAFVFNKTDEKRRQMTLVTSIAGYRSVAARSGNYRPDDRKPEWVFDDAAKNPLTNPYGIVECTVGVFHRPTRSDTFERIVHTVYWDEIAPIVQAGDADDYEWVETGEVYEDSGKAKKKRRLREGSVAVFRLDPKKEAWIKSGRNQIAKCAEAGALRKGWPDDLSRLLVEEETHRAATLDDVEYTDLTPSQMAEQGAAEMRQERIGGPAILATFDNTGALERVPPGQFADRVLAHIKHLPADQVSIFYERNREAFKEFWAHNKSDALELKKRIEERLAAPKAATAAAAPETEQKPKATHASNLLAEIAALPSMADCFTFAQEGFEDKLKLLSVADKARCRNAFAARQAELSKG